MNQRVEKVDGSSILEEMKYNQNLQHAAAEFCEVLLNHTGIEIADISRQFGVNQRIQKVKGSS